MNKSSNRPLMIGMFLLGFSIAAGYFLLVHPGLGTMWKKEQAPPEPISLLDLGLNGEIIGQAPSGSLYELLPAYNLP